MGDSYDDEKAYGERQARRLPWQIASGLCLLLALGIVGGVGLRGWIPATALVTVAIVALLWSLRK